MRGAKVPAQPPSMTSALLGGGPILGNQGTAGQIPSRKLKIMPDGTKGRLLTITADRRAGSRWSLLRSLPAYIPARSFAAAVIDLMAPDGSGQTTMDLIKKNVDALPGTISPFKPSLQALVKTAGDDVSQFRTAVERWKTSTRSKPTRSGTWPRGCWSMGNRSPRSRGTGPRAASSRSQPGSGGRLRSSAR